MDFARRRFLTGMTKLSALAALPALGTALDKSNANTETEETITFELKFTGPFGFIPYDKYIYVYAPDTTFEHYPVASTDYFEIPLLDENSYSVDWVLPRDKTSKYFPPIMVSAPSPINDAQKNCRIGIKVPNPDIIKGINLATVKVNGGPYQLFPTGLRFIYHGVPKSSFKAPIKTSTTDPSEIELLKRNPARAWPGDHQSYDPVWELSIRMVPETILDPCHQAAKLSFVEVAKLCSVQMPPVLNYGDPTPHCHAPLPHVIDNKEHFNSTEILRGPGSDCQTLALWVNPV